MYSANYFLFLLYRATARQRENTQDFRVAHDCLSKGYFKNSVRNAYFTGVSAIAYAPFSIVVSVIVASRAAFSFAIRSFSALRRL